ncbi:hypothetical protein D0849_05285 [Bordetella avium]|nr:hypothetical protein D0849_05285 [Bordetella avium]
MSPACCPPALGRPGGGCVAPHAAQACRLLAVSPRGASPALGRPGGGCVAPYAAQACRLLAASPSKGWLIDRRRAKEKGPCMVGIALLSYGAGECALVAVQLLAHFAALLRLE